jgi:hypothetical protein
VPESKLSISIDVIIKLDIIYLGSWILDGELCEGLEL